jgi:hypothetical protein
MIKDSLYLISIKKEGLVVPSSMSGNQSISCPARRTDDKAILGDARCVLAIGAHGFWMRENLATKWFLLSVVGMYYLALFSL